MKAENGNELNVESAVKVDPLQNPEVQIGWTALLEGYRNFWLNQGASYQEVRLFTGVEPELFVQVGWLKKTTEQFNQCFFPDGALALQLARDAEPSTLNEFPASHPTTPERSTARQAQSGSSQTTETESAAIGLGVQTDAATSAPSTVARRGGRWDANPVESGLTRDLAEVIGVLKVAGDSVRERLTEITQEQQQEGWPDKTKVFNAVAHLRRLASDLFNELADFELKSQLNLHIRKGGVR